MLIDENVQNDRLEFDDILERIAKKIKSHPGILIMEHKVVTLEEVSMEARNNLQHWDFDYLSHRDKPGGKTIKQC